MAREIGHLERVRALAVGGRFVAVGGARAAGPSVVTLYDPASNRATRVAVPCAVLGLCAAPAGFVAACADGAVRWIGGKGEVEREVSAHRGACTAVAASGERVASVGDDGVVRVFGPGASEHALSARPLRAVAFDAAGDQLAVAGDDGVVRVLARDGAVREMPGHDGPVYGLAFTPAGDRLLSAGDDGTLRIWFLVGPVESDVRGAGETGHAGGAVAVAFLPGATDIGAERFVSAGRDGKLKWWRMNDRRRPRTTELSGEPLAALAVSPGADGADASVWVGGDARTVWAASTGDAPVVPHAHGFDALDAALRGKVPARRIEAVRALVALDEPEALALVARTLDEDRDASVKVAALESVAQAGRVGAVPAVRARLDDLQNVVRAAAYHALVALLADAPLTAARHALASSAADVRQMGVDALPALVERSPLALGWLVERLADPEASVRRAALMAYRSVEPPPSVGPLRAAFERGGPDVRSDALALAATDGLGAEPAFAPLLEKALDDADDVVRRIAFVAAAAAEPVLARWLVAHDRAFAAELGEVARRAVQCRTGGDAPEAVEAARSALAPAGSADPPAEAQRRTLLAALTCRMADTALRGARGLALLQDSRALGALLTLTRESSAPVRRGAAEALAAYPDPQVRQRIGWMLGDPDAGVRDAALTVLGTLEAPLDVAERALRSPQEDIRHRGLMALVQHGRGVDRGAALLADSLDDEAPKVRAEAFRTYWSWHADRPLTAIDRATGARFADVRKRGVDELVTLGRTDPGAVTDRLVAACADPDEGVGKAAHAGLVGFGPATAARAHVAALRSPVAAVRVAGAVGAGALGAGLGAETDAARAALVERLGDDDAAVRRAAIDALDAVCADPEPLRAGLRVSHLDVRVRAAEHLAQRRDPALVQPMLALLADPDLIALDRKAPTGYRLAAASAFATLGAPEWVDAYHQLVGDDDGGVREQGARGLAGGCRPEHAHLLVTALDHADLAVRSWAAEGLARLGDPRGLPVLIGTLKHPHPPIRVGAVLALAALGAEAGLLAGLEDPAIEVQRILLVTVLARDLAALRRGEPADLAIAALASARHEVRFAVARALELRADPGAYLAHLVEVLLPDPPSTPPQPAWPEDREHRMVGLAFALAGDRSEQRYAALQVLRLRDRPALYFREAARVAAPRVVSEPWVPETTPRGPADAEVAPLRGLRRLFASASDTPVVEVSAEVRDELARIAFGAYVGLVRQVGGADAAESHRVRRDSVDRIAALVGPIPRSTAITALARALDDPHHLVRRAAFAALERTTPDDPETPLGLALACTAPDVLRTALDRLAARGPSAFARVAGALDSEVPEARRYAFEVLERLSPEAKLEPLLAALKSRHADIRIGVVERLATSQDPRVFAALGTALLSDHDDLRIRAAELLAARRDDRAVDILDGALRSDEHADRARDALVRIGSPAAVRALDGRLADAGDASPDEGERLALVDTLGRIRSADAVRALVGRYDDPSAEVRHAAWAGVLAIAGPRADAWTDRSEPRPAPRDEALLLAGLVPALRSKDPELRAGAARELDEVAHPDADALLRGLFGDRAREVARAAVTAYASRAGADPAPLLGVVEAGARDLTLPAAAALAARPGSDPTGTPRLLRALLLYARAGEPDERVAALLALGSLGDPRALPELEVVAAGGTEEAPVEPEMAAAAVEALGRAYRWVASPDVHERIRDRIEIALGDRRQGPAAVRALGHVGGDWARVRLEATLAADRLPDEACTDAARALGAIGDPASERVLAHALEHWSSDVRWAARDALERLFPNDRARVELLAANCGNDDLAEPAAEWLAERGDPASLVAALERIDDAALRDRLRYGLASRSEVPVDGLVALLGSASAEARADAAWVVGQRPDVPDRERLAVALAGAVELAGAGWAAAVARGSGAEDARDAEQQAWQLALWASRRLGGAATRAAAAAALGRTDAPSAVRLEAAHALAGDPEGAGALVAAASDPELDVRFAAVSALGRPHGADPVAAARGVDPDRLEVAAPRAAWLPTALRAGKLDALIALARGGDGADRLDAIGALGLSRAPAAAEVLTALASDEDAPEAVRKAAFRAVRRIGRAEHRARTRTEATP